MLSDLASARASLTHSGMKGNVIEASIRGFLQEYAVVEVKTELDQQELEKVYYNMQGVKKDTARQSCNQRFTTKDTKSTKKKRPVDFIQDFVIFVSLVANKVFSDEQFRVIAL